MRIDDNKILERMRKYRPLPDHDALILNVAMTEQLTEVLLGEGGICDTVKTLTEDSVIMKTYWKITASVLAISLAAIFGIVWDIMH